MTVLRPGDIAACYGTCRESRVIRWATASPFAPRGLRLGPSHVAILADWRGLTWFESTSLCRERCLIRGDVVRGVQAHPPCDRIEDYTASGGRVAIYRLAPLWRLDVLECDTLAEALRRATESGCDYDLAGALLSGTRCLKLSRLWRADLDALFCSELIAAALQRLGRLCPQNPMHFNPASLLRTLVRTGVYRLWATWDRGGVEYARPTARLRVAGEEGGDPCALW